MNNKKFCCEFCDQYFSRKFCLDRHLDGRCKIIKNNNSIKQKIQQNESDNNKLDLLLNQNKELNNLLKTSIKQIPKINSNIKKLESSIPANSNLEISNQLVNKIIEKEKKINELDNELNLINEMIGHNDKQKIQDKITIIDDTICKNNINYNINEFNNKPINLILNNQIIQFREIDNYINATQLCKAGGKKLSHWINLDNTKELISELASDAGIPASLLIDSKKGYSNNFIQGTWIHSDLAIQLAQWISSKFAIQVSKWIRELFTKGNVNINLKIIKEQENIIKDNEKRIKILENLTLKRHKRTKYLDSNVVYIVQDPDNINDRKYVIGSAKDLTVRLSTYNKGSEFEVIYYKGFETEELMEQAEKIVLLKLRKYQEQANRDRFVLPIDKDIKLFTNAIDEAWKYFN